VGAARRLAVLADHTKWGTVGLSTIARLGDADVLITDVGLSEDVRKQLVEEVGELVTVDPAEADA
jgi:DeoR/GlpR family transcriptional regulator of sugar metabolism